MPYSAKAVAKYQAKVYDRVGILVKKGQRDYLKAYAAANGESLNGFINRAIKEAIERDKEKSAGSAGQTSDDETAE